MINVGFPSAAAIALLMLWLLPKWQVRGACLETKDRIDLEIKARAVLAQLIVGSLLLLTFYATWRSIDLSQRSLEAERRNHFAVRFASAVEMLGSAETDADATMAMRIGGIYALSRLANESEFDYEPIIQVLAGYVRSRTSLDTTANLASTSRPEQDVRVALDVIGDRRYRYNQGEAFSLDLSGSNLRGAKLTSAHLEGAFLHGSDLTNAVLIGSYFDGATLSETRLSGASLQVADLRGADLEGADLKGAFYDGRTKWPKGFDPKEHGMIRQDLPWLEAAVAERLPKSK